MGQCEKKWFAARSATVLTAAAACTQGFASLTAAAASYRQALLAMYSGMHASGRTALRGLLWMIFFVPAICPAQALQYTETEVSLKTPTGTLSGTQLLPAAGSGVPVVLLIGDSGPTDRDGNSPLLVGTNNCLKLLAQDLARNGIASVRYDKRGIGKSVLAAGAESALRFEHFALDAAAWARQLRADQRFSRVIVVGHSEGSLVGMLASLQAKADAFVSIAGPARALDEVLHDQLKPRAPAAVFEESERILKSLKQGTQVEEVSQSLAGLYRPAVQPYMISILKYVPRDVLPTLTMPVLIVQGTSDLQVPTADGQALKEARPEATLVVIDGMNHLFKMVGADPALQMASYSSPDMPVSPELIMAISTFIKALPPH